MSTNQSSFRQWTIGSTFYPMLVLAEVFGSSGTAQVVDLYMNGNNQYTILPIQITIDCYYQQQMDQLEEQRKWQQAKKRLGRTPEKAPCARL